MPRGPTSAVPVVKRGDLGHPVEIRPPRRGMGSEPFAAISQTCRAAGERHVACSIGRTRRAVLARHNSGAHMIRSIAAALAAFALVAFGARGEEKAAAE